ncbi:MAG: hypothetical protein ACKVT0_07015, partial [Planctomycetaceae bacterium]
DQGDVPSIGRILSPEFESEAMTKDEFLVRATVILSDVRIDQARIHSTEVVIDSNKQAVATIGATCQVRTADGFASSVPTRWRVRFAPSNETWLVTGIESIPVPPFHLRSINRP